MRAHHPHHRSSPLITRIPDAQRDIRDPKIKPAPPNAQVRAEQGGGGAGGGGGSRIGKRPLRDALRRRGAGASSAGGAEPSSPYSRDLVGVAPAQLSAHALMYLPPLTGESPPRTAGGVPPVRVPRSLD